jgi:hypothetical protein
VPRGRTIRLAVAILPAPNRAPDPVVYLSNRPEEDPLLGADTLVEIGLTEDRDLILMSQRATYSSEPGLSCPEVDRLRARMVSLHYERRLDRGRLGARDAHVS